MSSTLGRAALTDIPLAGTLPLLVLAYLSDDFNHLLRSFPLLLWSAIVFPIVAVFVLHEVVLSRSSPQWAEAIIRIPSLSASTIRIMGEVLAVSSLIGIALLFFWPVFAGYVPVPADLLPQGPPWGGLLTNGPPVVRNPVGSDSLWLMYPYAHFRYQVAESTLFPLWNPYVFAGTPFLAESSNTQLLQPFHALFALLAPGAALATVKPLYLALTGISTYVYLRLIRLSRSPALLGAITFMFSSVAAWWLLLDYFYASGVWLFPLVLVGAELILRGHYRWGVLVTTVALTLTLLGNAQIAFYTALAFGFYGVWMLAVRWRTDNLRRLEVGRRLAGLAGSGLLAIGIAAAQLVPTLELAQTSHRTVFTDSGSIVPLPLSRILTVLLPGIGGYPPSGTTWGAINPNETTLYLGIVPLSLAVFALLSRPTRYHYWCVALIAMSLLLAMAKPITEILATVFPPLELFPPLGRLLYLVKFGLALLAAFGANALLERKKIAPDRVLLVLLASAAILLLAATFALFTQEWPNAAADEYPRAQAALRDSLRWLAAMALISGAALFAVRAWNRMIPIGSTILLCAAALIDLAGYAAPLYTYASPSSIYPATPITTYLQRKNSERLFRIVGVPRTTFLSNSAMVYGLSDARGYNALYPLRIFQFAQLVNGRDPVADAPILGRHTGLYSDDHRVEYDTLFDVRLLSLLNVEYIVLDKQYNPSPPLDLSAFEFVMEQPGLRGGILYRNPSVLPRVFLVGNAETVSSSAEAIKRLQDPEFEPARQIVLENSSPLPTFPVPQNAWVEIERYESERVLIHVETNTPAWLLLTDTYYPGWQATVNGEDTPIYPADLLFRAIAVPAGGSDVEFTYRPASWRWGARISLVALACWLVVLLYPAGRAIAIRARGEGELMRWLRRTTGIH